MLGPAFGGFSLLHTGYGLGMSSASFPRYDNQVFYQTPSMGGIKAAAGYAFSVNDTRNAETGYATANNTRHHRRPAIRPGPAQRLRLGYDQLNASWLLSAAQAAATPRAYIIGASYDFTALKIAVACNRVPTAGSLAGAFATAAAWADWQAPDVCVFQGTALQFPCHRARCSDGPVGTCVRFMAAH